MHDEEFDNWIKTSAQSYNQPPAPDVEGMWAEIEKQVFNKSAPVTDVIPLHAPKRTPWYNAGWLKVAAALIIGVGVGRVSMSPSALAPQAETTVAAAPVVDGTTVLQPVLNTPEANKYMGETIALLASLQTDAANASSDKKLAVGAADLLNTTRFLLDSPDNNNPEVRGLLEDLELVLAQIVQLSNQGTASDVEMIHQAMEQRDVMPRLRTAVANNYSAE
ncbi:MAG: hypothetical protein ACO1Q7_02620 [Gemmatimonas sp.]